MLEHVVRNSVAAHQALVTASRSRRSILQIGFAAVAGVAAGKSLAPNVLEAAPDTLQNDPWIEELGALEAVSARYQLDLRGRGSGPMSEWHALSIARFEDESQARTAVESTKEAGMTAISEEWPTVELSDQQLPVATAGGYRLHQNGMVSRPGTELFATLEIFQIGDIVGTAGGYSNLASAAFEIAYLTNTCLTLYQRDPDATLADLLPTNDMLIGNMTRIDQ